MVTCNWCFLIDCHLVHGVFRAWVLDLHQYVGMQEVGGDHVRDERSGIFLEDGRHNVISYVSFPLELWKQRRR